MSGYFEFPTNEDWKRLYNAASFDKIFSFLDDFAAKSRPGSGWTGLTKAIELNGCIYEIQHRLADTSRSHILMMFYYEKGIPDKRWYISPGKNGESVQYFPDFEEEHFYIKGWFDFYSDVFYYKLFSTWDLIGHALNVKYDLGVKRVDFGKAVRALEGKNRPLHDNLESIRNAPAFQTAKKIRDNITHNSLPNTVGMAVYKGDRFETVGLKHYTTSDEIVANVRETVALLEATMQHISA